MLAVVEINLVVGSPILLHKVLGIVLLNGAAANALPPPYPRYIYQVIKCFWPLK